MHIHMHMDIHVMQKHTQTRIERKYEIRDEIR
jgi:hypothetical protein